MKKLIFALLLVFAVQSQGEVRIYGGMDFSALSRYTNALYNVIMGKLSVDTNIVWVLTTNGLEFIEFSNDGGGYVMIQSVAEDGIASLCKRGGITGTGKMYVEGPSGAETSPDMVAIPYGYLTNYVTLELAALPTGASTTNALVIYLLKATNSTITGATIIASGMTNVATQNILTFTNTTIGGAAIIASGMTNVATIVILAVTTQVHSAQLVFRNAATNSLMIDVLKFTNATITGASLMAGGMTNQLSADLRAYGATLTNSLSSTVTSVGTTNMTMFFSASGAATFRWTLGGVTNDKQLLMYPGSP